MEFKEYIAAYKEIRKTVQFGTLYRLSSVRNSSLHGVEYISKDEKEIVVFVFHQGNRFGSTNPILYLQGLNADALYRIEETEEKVHGSTLMKAGLETGLWGDFDSRLIRLTQIQEV
jgi:alpha-galactosidase